MQIVSIDSKNVDSVTREGKTYLYFTAGFSPFAAAMEPAYEKFLAAAADCAGRAFSGKKSAHPVGVSRRYEGTDRRRHRAAGALHQFTEILLNDLEACLRYGGLFLSF